MQYKEGKSVDFRKNIFKGNFSTIKYISKEYFLWTLKVSRSHTRKFCLNNFFKNYLRHEPVFFKEYFQGREFFKEYLSLYKDQLSQQRGF